MNDQERAAELTTEARELIDLARLATRGPWGHGCHKRSEYDELVEGRFLYAHHSVGEGEESANGDFITAARSFAEYTLPALLKLLPAPAAAPAGAEAEDFEPAYWKLAAEKAEADSRERTAIAARMVAEMKLGEVSQELAASKAAAEAAPAAGPGEGCEKLRQALIKYVACNDATQDEVFLRLRGKRSYTRAEFVQELHTDGPEALDTMVTLMALAADLTTQDKDFPAAPAAVVLVGGAGQVDYKGLTKFYFIENDSVSAYDYVMQCRAKNYHILKQQSSEEPRRVRFDVLDQTCTTEQGAWAVLIQQHENSAEWIKKNIMPAFPQINSPFPTPPADGQ